MDGGAGRSDIGVVEDRKFLSVETEGMSSCTDVKYVAGCSGDALQEVVG